VTGKKKARMGRPPLPKRLQKGALLSVRFSISERQLLERAAHRSALGLSEWSRSVLLAAAERIVLATGSDQRSPKEQ
jgi:uncharacterized protein (DUF1778 family)